MSNPTSTYLALFTSQYQNSPNLLAFAQAMLKNLGGYTEPITTESGEPLEEEGTTLLGTETGLVLGDDSEVAIAVSIGPGDILETEDYFSHVVDGLSDVFHIDKAIGVQLDTLGVILGRSRMLPFTPTDGSSAVLNDDNYRILLKAKIAINQWNGQKGHLDELWQNLFPGSSIMIRDNQDMTLDVAVYSTTSSIFKELAAHDLIVPRPQGVQINYSWDPNLPYFGFGLDNAYFSGFGRGNWAFPII